MVLYDKLHAIIRLYGRDIFEGDSKAKMSKRAVNLRNKIDHITKKKNVMSGEEAGFYLHKFSLLYRIIMLEKIGVSYEEIQDFVKTWTRNMNNSYPKLRIIP